MSPKIDSEVLARERKYLFMFAMMRLRDPDLAEDAVQDTLVAALQSLDRFEGRSSIRTWLVAILRNKIADMMSKRGREVSADEMLDSLSEETDEGFDERGHWDPEAKPRSWSSPEQALERDQFWGVFEQCLKIMSPRIGEVFVLREVMGESIGDICKNLEITEANCSVMLYGKGATEDLPGAQLVRHGTWITASKSPASSRRACTANSRSPNACACAFIS